MIILLGRMRHKIHVFLAAIAFSVLPYCLAVAQGQPLLPSLEG
jgi:hypothetical protein